jgi:glutamate-1-semialdehyde 2,1-aminomutase
VTQVGARTEFQFTATPPRNGSEADAILDSDMEHIIHLFLLNRGLLITPFHNMLLICPQTTQPMWNGWWLRLTFSSAL